MPANLRILILGAFALSFLMACGSSPQVRYFSLSPMESGHVEGPEDAPILGLGPLRMPEYLNRSQLVTRGSGTELRVDEFNRWAEPLNLSVHRVVSSDVDKLVDGLVVVAFPYETVVRSDVDYRLVGYVNRFEADSSGRVVLDIQWAISEVGGDTVVSARRSRYEAQAASPDDPGGIAAAMNDALAKFSRDIAGQMETVLQDGTAY